MPMNSDEIETLRQQKAGIKPGVSISQEIEQSKKLMRDRAQQKQEAIQPNYLRDKRAVDQSRRQIGDYEQGRLDPARVDAYSKHLAYMQQKLLNSGYPSSPQTMASVNGIPVRPGTNMRMDGGGFVGAGSKDKSWQEAQRVARALKSEKTTTGDKSSETPQEALSRIANQLRGRSRTPEGYPIRPNQIPSPGGSTFNRTGVPQSQADFNTARNLQYISNARSGSMNSGAGQGALNAGPKRPAVSQPPPVQAAQQPVLGGYDPSRFERITLPKRPGHRPQYNKAGQLLPGVTNLPRGSRGTNQQGRGVPPPGVVRRPVLGSGQGALNAAPPRPGISPPPQLQGTPPQLQGTPPPVQGNGFLGPGGMDAIRQNRTAARARHGMESLPMDRIAPEVGNMGTQGPQTQAPMQTPVSPSIMAPGPNAPQRTPEGYPINNFGAGQGGVGGTGFGIIGGVEPNSRTLPPKRTPSGMGMPEPQLGIGAPGSSPNMTPPPAPPMGQKASTTPPWQQEQWPGGVPGNINPPMNDPRGGIGGPQPMSSGMGSPVVYDPANPFGNMSDEDLIRLPKVSGVNPLDTRIEQTRRKQQGINPPMNDPRGGIGGPQPMSSGMGSPGLQPSGMGMPEPQLGIGAPGSSPNMAPPPPPRQTLQQQAPSSFMAPGPNAPRRTPEGYPINY